MSYINFYRYNVSFISNFIKQLENNKIKYSRITYLLIDKNHTQIYFYNFFRLKNYKILLSKLLFTCYLCVWIMSCTWSMKLVYDVYPCRKKESMSYTQKIFHIQSLLLIIYFFRSLPRIHALSN